VEFMEDPPDDEPDPLPEEHAERPRVAAAARLRTAMM